MIEVDEKESAGSRWMWVAGAVAVALAVVIVAGLVFVRQRGSAQPAAAGHRIGALAMTTQIYCQIAMELATGQGQAELEWPSR